MSRKPRLTPTEWELMEAIWSLGTSVSVREVLEHAYPHGEKAYTTVQTTMNILEKKGLLRRRKTGLVNFYTPVRSREEMVRAEVSSLIARVFSGSIPAVASSLLSMEDLSLEEIAQIKKILKRKERELKEGSS